MLKKDGEKGNTPPNHESVKEEPISEKVFAKNVKDIWLDPTTGKEFTLKKAKAKHSIAATKLMNGDQSLYMPALMSKLLLIDGKAPLMEDVAEFDLPTYNLLVEKMADANFI